MHCAITDGTGWKRSSWLLDRIAALGDRRVDLLIVREHGLDPEALIDFTRRAIAVAGQMQVLLAGEAGLALAAGAAGVHLSTRADEQTIEQVRRQMPAAFVTQSCHTLDEVRQAHAAGADAVLFGPVFGKRVDGVEVVAGTGLERLAEACALGVPVFALGGVDAANAPECEAAGAKGAAAIWWFFN